MAKQRKLKEAVLPPRPKKPAASAAKNNDGNDNDDEFSDGEEGVGSFFAEAEEEAKKAPPPGTATEPRVQVERFPITDVAPPVGWSNRRAQAILGEVCMCPSCRATLYFIISFHDFCVC